MKNGKQIPWNATVLVCDTFKISCLMGRLYTKDVLENLFKGLVHWLSITLFLRKTSQGPSMWKESVTCIVAWIRSLRWENLEG